MGDQGRWFKLWTSAVSDPNLRALSLEDFGRWCALGVYLKLHGDNGHLEVRAPAIPLQELLRLSSFEDVVSLLSTFPHCHITTVTNCPVTLSITWDNWQRYQGDYSGDRVRRWRQTVKRSRNGHVTPKEEMRRDEKRREVTTPPLPLQADAWPSPTALVALYNDKAPDECPAVTKLSPARVKKAKAYLAAFPDQAFWEETFAQITASRFLRGLKAGNGTGHDRFVADLDWLLTRGKDGSENCVKVYEGKYHD